MRTLGTWFALASVVAACGEIGDPAGPRPPGSYVDPHADADVLPDAGDGWAAADAADSTDPLRDDAGVGCGDGTATDPIVDFADVRPILQGRCTDCHDDGGSAGLDLRTYAGVMAGGSSGPVVVAGDCEGSVLWQKTGPEPPFGSRMPADGPPWLSDGDRATLCEWIRAGAVESAPSNPDPCPLPDGGATHDGGVEGDTTPPVFDGCDDAEVTGDRCVMAWELATDDTTPTDQIVYEIYAAPEDHPFGDPVLVTAPGALGASLDGLDTGRDWDVSVRAVDRAGNRDSNMRVRTCAF